MRKPFWVGSVLVLLAVGGCVVDPTYTFCNSGSDCEVEETCFVVRTLDPDDDTLVVTEGAFCSEECTSSGQCETNLAFPGACMDVDEYGAICFQQCDFVSDCFSTSTCTDFEDQFGVFNRVCLPDTL